MIIRSATLSDRKKIALTHKASIETLCAGHYSAHEIAGWVRIISPTIYNNAIQEKIMIVAEEDGEILGLGILDVDNREINAVYIHPEATSAGTGSNVLAELEQRASKAGVDHLALCSTINASGFYRKCGYTGSEVGFHELPNGIRLKCIRMRKTIKNNS